MKSFPQPDDRNIRLYLTDKMTQAEHLAMETQIGSNPALVQQIQMEANLRFVHRYSIDFERIETLHAIQNSILIEPDFQFPDSGTAFALRNFVHKLQWWKIFAGVALVTGLVFSWLQWTNQQTVQLIQIELIPYPNTLNAGPTSPALLSDGIAAYKSGNFKQAAQSLQVYAGSTDDSNVRFYAGVSYLLSANPNRAVELLEPLTDDPTWREAACWYTGLSYLKLNKKDEAKVIWQKIPDGSRYKLKAGQIIDF